MNITWRLVILLISLGSLSMPAYGKNVFLASQLGPYDFQSYIETTTGSVIELAERNSTFTAVEIVDPVIEGIKLSGVITTDAQMTIAGPTTWLNIELAMNDPAGIELGTIDVVSEITYELAAFGTPDEAQVRINGGGISDTERPINGLLSIARASGAARIAIYETDVLGNRADLLQLWQPTIPTNFPGQPFEELRFTAINGTFTIDTNQVYEVVVKSTSRIVIANIQTFDITAYAFIGSLFSSATDGVEVAVSSFENPDVNFISPPAVSTLRSDDESTDAIIAGGARLVDSDSYTQNFVVGDAIVIDATLQPEPDDIRKTASVYVIVSSAGSLIQITAQGLAEFDGSESGLIPLTEISLRGVSEIDVLGPIAEQIDASSATLGKYEFFVGYATEGSPITFTEDPILVEVTEQ